MAGRKSRAQWEELFRQYDQDGSGSLSIQELSAMMRANDSNMSDARIADVFVSLEGPCGDRRISLEEFTSGIERLQDLIAQVTQVFRQTDQDGSGYLSQEEVRPLFRQVHPKMSDEEIDQAFQAVDRSGEGRLSLDEFLSACT